MRRSRSMRFASRTHLPRAARERGIAIITALVVMTLAALLVSGMLWRESIQVRRIENQRLLDQAQWVARGGLDWTRLVLRSEADSAPGITYLGGVWAVPLARTRLSDLIGKGDSDVSGETVDTYFSGSIEDAQAKFNLRNLVVTGGSGPLQLNAAQLGTFARLLSILGFDTRLAKTIALQMRAGLAHSATRFQNANAPGSAPPVPVGGGDAAQAGLTDAPGAGGDDDMDEAAGATPIMMISVDSLLDVPGITPAMVERLRPFVTVLPSVTAINMNTAPAEVVAAVVPGMTLPQAQAFVSRRETVFFRNTGDVQLGIQGAGVPVVSFNAAQIDVTTNYFIVHGRIQYERAEVDRTSLVYRDPLTHTTRLVRSTDQL